MGRYRRSCGLLLQKPPSPPKWPGSPSALGPLFSSTSWLTRLVRTNFLTSLFYPCRVVCVYSRLVFNVLNLSCSLVTMTQRHTVRSVMYQNGVSFVAQWSLTFHLFWNLFLPFLSKKITFKTDSLLFLIFKNLGSFTRYWFEKL